MKYYNYKALIPILIITFTLISCKDQTKDMLIGYPNDITFNSIKLDRFSFKIPEEPFQTGNNKSGIVTINVKKYSNGSFGGFALSNKNWRSYPWSLSPDFPPSKPLTNEERKAVIDSCIFSVFTSKPNKTGTYLVGAIRDDDAFISLGKPTIVEHILVANTTYNYLLTNYGSVYSGTLNEEIQSYSLTGEPVKNIKIENPSTDLYGRWYLPGQKGEDLISLEHEEILAKMEAGHKAALESRAEGESTDQASLDSISAADELSKGYVKLLIDGFNGKELTGTVEFLLAVRPNVSTIHKEWDFVMDDWNMVDLTSLGLVDKLVFHYASSYKNGNGEILTPPYFCLDGIRLKE